MMYHVRDLFKEAEVQIPDAVLDRVHRITKEISMSSFILLLFDIERYSIITVKNLKTKVYILILLHLGCHYQMRLES